MAPETANCSATNRTILEGYGRGSRLNEEPAGPHLNCCNEPSDRAVACGLGRTTRRHELSYSHAPAEDLASWRRGSSRCVPPLRRPLLATSTTPASTTSAACVNAASSSGSRRAPGRAALVELAAGPPAAADRAQPFADHGSTRGYQPGHRYRRDCMQAPPSSPPPGSAGLRARNREQRVCAVVVGREQSEAPRPFHLRMATAAADPDGQRVHVPLAMDALPRGRTR